MNGALVELAAAAGLALSETETALLQALSEHGSFDGIEYRRGLEGTGTDERIGLNLPSVWSIAPPDEDAEGDSWETHPSLYAKAPFPTVSGAVLTWLVQAEAGRHLQRIQLVNLKLSGDWTTLNCDLNISLTLVACVFESWAEISGRTEGGLRLTGVHARGLRVSGDYPSGIVLNDVQCRGRRGRARAIFTLRNVRSPELDIYGMFSAGGVVLQDCEIPDVHIRGNLWSPNIQLVRGEFKDVIIAALGNGPAPAFSASKTSILHECFLRGLRGVDLTETAVGGDLRIIELTSDGESTLGFIRLSGVTINGTLGIDLSPGAAKVTAGFTHVRTQRYEDRAQDIAALESVELEGLEYQDLVSWGADEASERMRWLALQPTEPFPGTSWRRVAGQLRRRGRPRDARRLLIEGERRRRKAVSPGRGARLWSSVLRVTTGYGWELWRTGIGAAAVVAIGSVVAATGMKLGLLVQSPTGSPDVAFNPVVYALDSALPIIDLRHESLWIPTGQGWAGRLVQAYFWFHIAAGWLLGTLFVTGLTGLARRSDDG